MKMSNTIQRRIIVEELKKLTTHPNAETLYEIVRRRLPRISLGTVYRNLELLSSAGTVLKLEVSGREKRFDGNTMRHYHMRCEECGAIEDVFDENLVFFENELRKRLCGRVKTVNFDFSGVCLTCSEKKECYTTNAGETGEKVTRSIPSVFNQKCKGG